MKIANSLMIILISCLLTLNSLSTVNAQEKRVYMNGQLMQRNVVAQAEDENGSPVSSGEYTWDGSKPYDGNDNSAPGRGPSNNDGSWSSESLHGPSTVYDSSGGCEGGSCVNIVW